MEQDVRLVVLEHLGNKLDVHVLDVDILSQSCQTVSLRVFLNHHTCKFLFMARTASLSFSCEMSVAIPNARSPVVNIRHW